MKTQNSPRAKILAFGSAFPDQVVTNADLEKIVDTTDEWIRTRSGIQERRKLRDGENNSDLAAKAAKNALKKAGLSANDLDLIISCSNTPDKWLPAMSCVVQSKIEAKNAAAFDILAACAGWIVGISVAEQFIRAGTYKNILVSGSEAMSRFVNWKDRSTCVLFGDGAGAAIVSAASPNEESGIISTHIHADGRYGDILDMPAAGSETPITHEGIEQNLHYFHMKGAEVYKHAVVDMAACSAEALEKNNLTMDDVDWLIPHQANIRIIEGVAKKLKFPMEKVLLNVHKYGNTSSATIPTCVDEFIDNGKIKRGDLLLLTSFGGGLIWGSALIRY